MWKLTPAKMGEAAAVSGWNAEMNKIAEIILNKLSLLHTTILAIYTNY